MDERISTSSYVLKECKDLLGKFGQVHDVVFRGGQSVVYLTNSQVYQNGQVHQFIRHVTDGGKMVHTRVNHANMFM